MTNEDTLSKNAELPKIDITSHNNLFILHYSNVPKIRLDNIPKIKKFNIDLYIDLPFVDHQNSKFSANYAKKFIKKYKLNDLKLKLKNLIYNHNIDFIDKLNETQSEIQLTFKFHSSGSLYYVESIKFLLESIYSNFINNENIKLIFEIQTTHLSKKWFQTFLHTNLIHLINFKDIESLNSESTENNMLMKKNPLKNYYIDLNEKFTQKSNRGTLENGIFETITIVTNATGIKALLTILADHPIFSYISKESIKTFESNSLNTVSNYNDLDDSQHFTEPPIRKDSSAIMLLQNNELTSNKDRSVRIRSYSLTNRPKPSNSKILLKKLSKPVESNEDESSDNTQFSKNEYKSSKTKESNASLSSSSNSSDYDDDDDDDDDEKLLDEANDRLTIDIPNKLSRTSSFTNTSVLGRKSEQHKKNRFRSLSLMDSNNNSNYSSFKKNKTFVDLKNVPLQENSETFESNALRSPPLIIKSDYNNVTKEIKPVTNIHIHDGNYEDLLLYSPSNHSRKNRRRNTLTLNSNQPLLTTSNIIPPEFYSRISSPSTSNNSSTASLQTLGYSGSLKVSDLLNSSKQNSSSSQHKLFEKGLISNSFEELRRQPSNLFTTLIGGFPENSFIAENVNPLALNFKSRTKNKNLLTRPASPSPSPSPDEEDMMASGELEQQPTVEKGSTPNLALNLKLYPTNDSKEDFNKEFNLTASTDLPKKGYKKAVTIDLYGDSDDVDEGAWTLGGNFK